MALRRAESEKHRDLLDRILETPDLARVVPGLEPAVLHRLLRRCGLEDAGPIVALATSAQLRRIFDDDLWRSEQAGTEELFDVDRFSLWLEVLAEAGADVAAAKIAGMDLDFVTAALSPLLLVLAPASPALEEGGTAWAEYEETGLACEMSGFTVVARRRQAWDAVLAVLSGLDASHHGFFSRLMARCAALVDGDVEDDSGFYSYLSPSEQVIDEVAGGREERREAEGYVTPPMAAAFLQLARQPIGGGDAPPPPDHVTAAYFRAMAARAHTRGDETTPGGPGPAREARRPEVESFLATLREEGVLPAAPVPLLARGPGGKERFERIRARLLEFQEKGPAAQARPEAEMAFLANVLVAGCSLQSRRFRTAEAADAVLAACNLGLENWPRRWPPADLVTTFRMGWSVAYERVSLHAARRLVATLAGITCDDDELRDDLAGLRRRLESETRAGTPWRARDLLDVLAILDPPSWATLLGLIDECPVLPRAMERPSGPRPSRLASGFDFISENRHVAWALDFLDSLPDRLAGLDHTRSPVR